MNLDGFVASVGSEPGTVLASEHSRLFFCLNLAKLCGFYPEDVVTFIWDGTEIILELKSGAGGTGLWRGSDFARSSPCLAPWNLAIAKLVDNKAKPFSLRMEQPDGL